MNKNRLLTIITVVMTLTTITVNVLANALPINGLDTGQISDRFDIYFVPAAYVFSIWGLIYLGLLAFTVYQAPPAQQENAILASIRPWYIVSSLGNIAWIFLWHYERFLLTMPAMLTILVSLIAIFLKLWAGRQTLSTAAKATVTLPFNIYLGWISVATVANTTQFLYFIDWGRFGLSPEVWAVAMLVIAAGIAITMSLRHSNIAYVGVFVWAYIGIAVKHSSTPIVGITAAVLAGVIGLSPLLNLKGLRRRVSPALSSAVS